MKTQLLKPNEESIKLACELLKNGEVVGLPTETVYGLAGDCSNPSAIKKIFEAKGIPMDNPLIVHISSIDMLDGIVKEVNDDALKMMKAFWPGPLTIIMPKGPKVCNESCAGLDSVGVRMPSNEIARKVIALSKTPFSAPSANLSGKPSPTNAKTVYNDMNGKIPLIIDGGDCETGVESTVISVLNKTPIILRPGAITKEMIEDVLKKPIKLAGAITKQLSSNKPVLSPGMKYKHYAPNANVIILKGSLKKFTEYVNSHKTPNTFALVFDEEKDALNIPTLTYGRKNYPGEQSHNLFTKLRELDALNAKTVYARCPQKKGVGLAVYNRLIRSAGFNIIKLWATK